MLESTGSPTLKANDSKTQMDIFQKHCLSFKDPANYPVLNYR
jgi:hypothetical protein